MDWIHQSWQRLEKEFDACRAVPKTAGYFLSSDIFQGSIVRLQIPCDIANENKVLLGISALRVGHEWMHHTSSGLWATPLLSSVLGLAHVGVRSNAFSVSLNPYRIVEKHEYYRMLTSVVSQSSTTQFLNSLGDVYSAGCQMEAMLGGVGMVGGMGVVSLLGQAFYVVATSLATMVAPALSLAQEYYRFSVGLSITAMGAQTMVGYLDDARESMRTKKIQCVRRYDWITKMLASVSLASLSSRYLMNTGSEMTGMLEQPSVYGHVAGVMAGVVTAHLMIPSTSWLGGRGGDGVRASARVQDIAIQCGLLVLTAAASASSSRYITSSSSSSSF